MKLKQISKYIKIREVSVQNPNSKYKTCFEVEMITNHEILLFGHIIKTKSNSQTVPFRFKTLEIAKDYCEVNPDMIIETAFSKMATRLRTITYNTWVIYKNDKKIAYVKWDDNFVIDKCSDKQFQYTIDSIVDKFVTNIKFAAYPSHYEDIKFENEQDKLSELCMVTNVQYKNKEIVNEWNYKLVEQ